MIKRKWAKVFKRRHVPGEMNGLERRFSERLDAMQCSGSILWWRFEAIRLRLTVGDKKTTYTPDFFVLMKTGEVEIYETKGHWTSAARVKTKVAADLYWFWKFRGAQWTKKGGWAFESFSKDPKEGE